MLWLGFEATPEATTERANSVVKILRLASRSVTCWVNGHAKSSFQIFDVRGQLVREFADAGTDKGLHTFRWDLRRQATSNRGGRRARFGRGSSVPAGTYLVKLTVDGDSNQTTVNVVNDPEKPSDRVGVDEEMESWLQFMDED